LSEVSEKVLDEDDAVKYFIHNYGKDFTNTLRDFSNECWKRAALIIGHALAGRLIVPRLEDLPNDVVESLGDALNRCSVDDYLLVGNEIPLLIWYLTYTRALAEAFIDKYNEVVDEVKRVLGIARGRGISGAEVFYGLGLASIIAKAVKLNKVVKPGGANAALHIASFAIRYVASPILIMPILRALEPLRGKAPQRYLKLLAPASGMENLDRDTVRYIFDELNEILDNYGDVVKEHAPSLVYAIIAYANLLGKHRVHFDDDEVKGVVGRVVDLLNELGKFKSSLGVIAWADALAPALRHEDVRGLMEEALRIDVVDKASKVLRGLSKMRKKVKKLMRDEEFMGYVESRFVKADEEAVKEEILEAASALKHALAIYRLGNDELDEAARLFNETAEEYREIGDYESYLINRGWVLRVEAIKAIKGSLVGDDLVKLVNGFRQLYEETFNEEHFTLTAEYLSFASGKLGEYLVSLALINDVEEIRKLLEERWWVLNADKEDSVLTRLMLNALLSPRGRLSSELKGKLSVNPEELINAFESDVDSEFLPALKVALEIAKPEDGIKLCEEFNDEDCVNSVLAVKGNSAAVKLLREVLIYAFYEWISEGEVVDLLRGLGFDAESLFDEFRGLVNGLDGKSLVQLIAPTTSMARLALMLHALINGDERLAKAHALIETVGTIGYKLPERLFLEAYKACCDLSNDEFRRAVARLFFYHV